MKIVLTGGGTGGHFYPLIAIAEELQTVAEQEHIPELSIFYFAPTPYDEKLLFKHRINFRSIPAGKVRIYFSPKNISDMFTTWGGIIKAFFTLFFIYPDVIFSKGGYASVPTVFAARLLRIPVVIHESDSAVGRANMWASKFAKKIAVSYPEAVAEFPKAQDRVAVTGQPIRKSIIHKTTHGSFQYLDLEENIPVLFILGGSQGAQKINEVILQSLLELLPKYQIIHQVGATLEPEVTARAQAILHASEFRSRYKVFGFLDSLAMSMAAGAASVIISRSGSTIFEIAAWGVPSIIIPIADSHGDHARKNAFNYARRGACSVIEESNFAAHVLIAEIDRILGDKELYKRMHENAQNFFDPLAARKISTEIIEIALSHEQ